MSGLIGLEPLRLDHDFYPLMRWQARCYCGAKKEPGLLTCGEHSLDAKVARHTEILLGGQSKPSAATRSTVPNAIPVSRRRPVTAAQREAAIKLRREQPGLSIRQIARHVGAVYSTAWLWLRERPAVTP